MTIEVELLEHMGDDLSVVNAARVSFNKQSKWEYVVEEVDEEWRVTISQDLSEKDKKLIDYLAREKHKSPFNHQFFSFRVKAPIFVARQLVKHEYLPWNEVSRRYVEGDLEWFFPDSWRSKVENVKQGSGEPLDPAKTEYIQRRYELLLKDAEELYNFALEQGLCAEQARMFLPQSLMTEWVWSGSFFAFIKMCSLRLGPGAQKESKQVAEKILEELRDLMPVSTEALMKHIERY